MNAKGTPRPFTQLNIRVCRVSRPQGFAALRAFTSYARTLILICLSNRFFANTTDLSLIYPSSKKNVGHVGTRTRFIWKRFKTNNQNKAFTNACAKCHLFKAFALKLLLAADTSMCTTCNYYSWPACWSLGNLEKGLLKLCIQGGDGQVYASLCIDVGNLYTHRWLARCQYCRLWLWGTASRRPRLLRALPLAALQPLERTASKMAPPGEGRHRRHHTAHWGIRPITVHTFTSPPSKWR